jgi:hypothetical protein
MQNTQKVREMLAQIGGACVQVTLGCEDCQHADFEVDVLEELAHALGELHKNAQQLLVMASSDTIDPALDHDGDTQPGHDAPELGCLEDGASCDCSWHENLRAAIASGGGVTQ